MDGKLDIRNPIYNDDDAARAHLEGLYWPQGPVCPRCGVMGDRITKLAGKSTRPGVYKCKDCRKPFSVTVGTVMERSHIPLSKWVLASQLMASSKKGFSAHELHRLIDTSYEAAWFLFHRLREAMDDTSSGPMEGGNTVVEVDESYIGGKEKNKHASNTKHMENTAYMMTDESAVHPPIGKDFAGHATVNHSAGEYVRSVGFHHTNTVESHLRS